MSLDISINDFPRPENGEKIRRMLDKVKLSMFNGLKICRLKVTK